MYFIALNTGATGEECVLVRITDMMPANDSDVKKMTYWLEIPVCLCSPGKQQKSFMKPNCMNNITVKPTVTLQSNIK